MAINSLMRKNWSHCPKKHQAREQTIIESYRNYFKMWSIPDERQYWTLCGKSGMVEGDVEGELENLSNGCELDQLLKAKLIKPSQFFGVEKESYIHKINQSITEGTWIQDDFYNAMYDAACENNFNPSIINYDAVHFPITNPDYTARIFKLIVDLELSDVMIILNLILKRPYRQELKPEEILIQLQSSTTFMTTWQMAMLQGKPWWFENKCTCYNGTGNDSRTTMGTVVFYR